MQELVLHPQCQPGPISRVEANLTRTPQGCEAEFRLFGDITAIKVPEAAEAAREDNLWQTTCFEIFWQPDGGSYYREFNLSPSSKWAAYDFASFREKTRDAPVTNIGIRSTHDGKMLMLKASVAADLPTPAQVALNAIVEDRVGNIQFWALEFENGKPEFHSEVCRQFRAKGRA